MKNCLSLLLMIQSPDERFVPSILFSSLRHLSTKGRYNVISVNPLLMKRKIRSLRDILEKKLLYQDGKMRRNRIKLYDTTNVQNMKGYFQPCSRSDPRDISVCPFSTPLFCPPSIHFPLLYSPPPLVLRRH